MSARQTNGWLGSGQKLTTAAVTPRQYELPVGRSLPKMEDVRPARVDRAGAIIGGCGDLPEMTSDVFDPATSYVACNVRRTSAARRAAWSRAAWGQWLERVLGGHRAARP